MYAVHMQGPQRPDRGAGSASGGTGTCELHDPVSEHHTRVLWRAAGTFAGEPFFQPLIGYCTPSPVPGRSTNSLTSL